MHQIVYMSRQTRLLTHDDCEHLALVCRRNNAANGLTGLLLYDGRGFIQGLEGPEGTVAAVMATIAADPRHTQIAYMADQQIEGRQFGDFAMNFRRVDDAAAGRNFVDETIALLDGVSDPRLRAAFIGFAAMRRRLSP